MQIAPQPGPQTAFLQSPADIVVYGGAAGGGKTYALLLEVLRNTANPRFESVIFRKNSNQIFSAGGLWDTAMGFYAAFATPKRTPVPCWRFPSGAKVTFAHLTDDSAVLKWQGSQIALICFDELTHFTRQQFFYMFSRNRSTCGVRPYIRATCNPDSDSWVAEFISWWIDQESGYPIPERSGSVRWMYRLSDAIYWADSPEELWERFGLVTDEERAEPKSVTFIASRLQDNAILMASDPGYLANLKALPTVERERLLMGNWKIRPAAGLYFKRARVNMLHELPGDIVKWVRAWDMAATEDNKENDPAQGAAYTAGVLMGKRKTGRYIIADVINRRMSAADVRQTIYNVALSDRAAHTGVRIRLNQDPGQAGKDQAEQYLKLLTGFPVSIVRESGSKETRAASLSAQWQGIPGSEKGNVDVLAAEWNDAYFSQLESFPQSKFKDMVDASATAFNEIESGAQYVPLTKGVVQANRANPWRI